MKAYTQAPLPFQGQKRGFLKQFKEALKGFEAKVLFVDLFGGSGLLAHTAKQAMPSARVVWNDFDGYSRRLEAISDTNRLLDELRPILDSVDRKGKIPEPKRHEVLKVIEDHERTKGYVDYITISASLLFSGKYALNYDRLTKEGMYTRLRCSPYDATGYLDGVERVSSDYKKVYGQFKGSEGVVFLVDPPYLSTDTSTYGNEAYWKLRDYLDVLSVLDGASYFYFTSNKSKLWSFVSG